MNRPPDQPTRAAPVDQDLAEQARPGHGIPSQDPNPAAQVALEPDEARREAGSALAGGGMVGGTAVGASIGVAVGGPVGAVVGGTLGAIAGAVGGAAAGTRLDPDDPDGAEPRSDGPAPAHPEPSERPAGGADP